MGNSIGRINLDLGINSAGFKSQLNGITKQGNGLAGVFGKLGKVVGAAFAVKAVVNFGKQCLQLGSDLAEVQNVVDVTFGSMSGKVNEFAKNAMTSFGMSEKVAKEYMGQFGAMSKAFGNTEQMAYDQAAALTGLAGDVASFYNMSTDEAFTKLKAVYTGETEALKSLGVVMTQTALDEFALQQGLGKTTKQMSEQEKVALRLKFVTSRLSDASGDFVRTADGWANQTRVLSLRFDALKASIGQGLINIFTPVIRVINEIVAKLQVAADAFKNFTVAVFGDAGGGGGGSGLAAGAEASTAIADNVDSAADSAAKLKKQLAGFDKLNVLGSSDSGSGSGGSSPGATAPGASTPSLSETDGAADKIKAKLGEIKAKLLEFSNIAGFTGLWNNFLIGVNNAKTGVLNLFTSLKNAIAANAPNFENLKNSLKNTFLTISNYVSTIWGDMWVILTEGFRSFTEENAADIEAFFTGIIEAVTNLRTLISDIVGNIYGSLNDWWENDGKRIWTEVVGCFKDIGAWFLNLWNKFLKPVIDWIIREARSLWDEYLKPLWDKILSLITSIWNVIKLFWDNVLKPIVNWVLTNLVPPIRDAIMGLVTVIKNVVAVFAKIFGGIIDTLKAVLDFVVDGFTNGWSGAWERLKKKFGEIWTGIKNTIAKPLNGILSGIEAFINGIIKGLNVLIRAINKISFKVPDWVPGIGGNQVGFNLKEISPAMLPRLATGGYVAANTPQLAVIGDNKHEGEIVAPESKIAEAVAQGFAMVLTKMQQPAQQRNSSTPVVIKIGETDFWEGFIDFHNSVVRRTGESPLLV